jgi:hypothetical protein
MAQHDARQPKREGAQAGLHDPVQGFRVRPVGEDHDLAAAELVAVDFTDTRCLDRGRHRPLGFEDQRPLIGLTEAAAQVEPGDHGMLRRCLRQIKECLGRYSFRAAVPAGGGRHPLTDPATREDDEQP